MKGVDLTDFYGMSRVIGEKGVLPQAALRLDPTLPILDTEMLIDVESLNIDAASFRQLEKESDGDIRAVQNRIESIIAERGKMHNSVTGSGGMLIGRVGQIGSGHPAQSILKVGDRIATLVSLTLTPLHLEKVLAIHPEIDRLDVRGHALLFASGLYARLPADLPDELSLAALDVCGAPALVARYAKPGMTVAILGAGKSGALSMAQARRTMKGSGRLIALDISFQALEGLDAIGLCDQFCVVDATDPVEVLRRVTEATNGQLCNLVVNCASVARTEMATILSVRSGGVALFFSMATQFSAATLGAEGVGKDVTLLMGNGYLPGHADLTLDLLRTEPGLRKLFAERYV